MKIFRLLTSLCALVSLGFSTVSSGAGSGPENLAIVGADVLPMTGNQRLADQTVLVSDGRIRTVGPRSQVHVPAGYRVINARGQTLMPGLVDMHVHLANERGRPGDAAQRALAVMLAHGVTTVRSMAGGANHIQLREAVENGSVIGPRIYAASPAINIMNTTTPDAARVAVRAAKAAGFDLIKSHHLPDVDVWKAVQDEAAKIGLPVAGHVTNTVGLDLALKAGEEVEHLDGAIFALLPLDAPERSIEFGQVPPPPVLEKVSVVKDAEIATLARAVAASHVYQVPTLAIFERVSEVEVPTAKLRSLPEMRFVPDALLDQWAQQKDGLEQSGFSSQDGSRFRTIRRRIVAAYNQAGVQMMAGSDTAQSFHLWGPGLIREVEALAASGLTPMQALHAATVTPRNYFRSLVNGGSALGWKADFGTVEQGARADLILLNGDPSKTLGALRSLNAVIAAGKLYDRAALDVMLDKAADDAKKTGRIATIPPPSSGASTTEGSEHQTVGHAETVPAAASAIQGSGRCDTPGLPPRTRCGSIRVPENRGLKSGRMLDIYYAVVPAPGGSSKAPLVVLPGGPGLGGVQAGAGIVQLFAPLLKDRDLLLIDQRGTGKSNRLACPLPKETGDSLSRLGGTPPEEVKDCRRALEKVADLGHYTTREAVLDMEQIRARLGYQTLDLFGMSYGTRVALDYLRLYPRHVEETVIRAAAPAEMLLPLWTPRDTQHSFDTLVAACRAQPDCAERHPSLDSDLKKIVARLDVAPAPITMTDPRTGKKVETTLDRAAFSSVMFFLLYIPEFYVQLPPLIKAAAAGNFSPIVQAVAPALLGTTDEVAWGMRWSVVCGEDVARINSRDIARATAGTFMGSAPVDAEVEACRLWPKTAVTRDYLKPVSSTKPVLIISGNMDPVAGKVWGDAISRHLPNSVHVEVAGASHLPPLPGCTPELVNKFFNGTPLKALDVSCTAAARMPRLRVARN